MINSAESIFNSNIAFGTSGARGLVTDFKPEVCTAFTLSFIDVMQKSFSFRRVAIAIDNRPSSPEIAAACISAARFLGIDVDYYGVIPTPALAVTSIQDEIPAIMVTGSHIPFDRNGLKFYRPDGEINKADELAILNAKITFPELVVANLPVASKRAADTYLARYLNLYPNDLLIGKRIGIYEHSSAGRDIYANLFERLGATVICLGRSDSFVPIDTEAIAKADIIRAQTWQKEHQLDVLFSTDGDGDRPLLFDEKGNCLRGDILCLLAAKSLSIEALAVPVNCNSSIEICGTFTQVKRTKIGSPYVIAAFDDLRRNFSKVAGFEANGGFLLGTDIQVNGVQLTALATRDAVLPVLAALAMSGKGFLSTLVKHLPQIYTASDRIQNFSRYKSLEIIENFLREPQQLLSQLDLTGFELVNADTTDGLRMMFSNGEVVHLRPSGNAPELRCYAESDSVDRAKSLVESVLNTIEKL
ncbi:phosphomannomutase [Shewanella algae]|uniref:phosphomannomutase n=1 Tax=Shewanella algae TaxID=38313 RepID=UPI001FBB8016|nr:phosphomannomutase [Shewanella algae]